MLLKNIQKEIQRDFYSKKEENEFLIEKTVSI